MKRKSKTQKTPRHPLSKTSALDFEALVRQIQHVHRQCVGQAMRAVNVSLTLRNWLIGFYIREYEQRGSDRAAYGEQLLERLSDRLRAGGLARTDERELRRYRQFYETYPQIRESLTPEWKDLLPEAATLWESPTPESAVPASKLLHGVSFTHLAELIKIEDPLKRAFYEVECLQGNWSVRQLRRQIASLYYERSALSKNKRRLAELTHIAASPDDPALAVRDPYVFEFLGLKPREVMRESDLEEALLDKLQGFLLELGRGFCFEARQKRILIGDDHFFVDLVFYHRILKCHFTLEALEDEPE